MSEKVALARLFTCRLSFLEVSKVMHWARPSIAIIYSTKVNFSCNDWQLIHESSNNSSHSSSQHFFSGMLLARSLDHCRWSVVKQMLATRKLCTRKCLVPFSQTMNNQVPSQESFSDVGLGVGGKSSVAKFTACGHFSSPSLLASIFDRLIDRSFQNKLKKWKE